MKQEARLEAGIHRGQWRRGDEPGNRKLSFVTKWNHQTAGWSVALDSGKYWNEHFQSDQLKDSK
ncbi:hypothetical protein [Thiolapillus sp.]